MYVNTTNASLDLSLGAVAQSLFKAGGPALQDECTAYQRTNGDVAEWDIATTAGADLKCKHVIHTVCSEYDGAASEQVMFACHFMIITVIVCCLGFHCKHATCVDLSLRWPDQL